jgi:hypothetical protein
MIALSAPAKNVVLRQSFRKFAYLPKAQAARTIIANEAKQLQPPLTHSRLLHFEFSPSSFQAARPSQAFAFCILNFAFSLAHSG